jgi:hypothetical protein
MENAFLCTMCRRPGADEVNEILPDINSMKTQPLALVYDSSSCISNQTLPVNKSRETHLNLVRNSQTQSVLFKEF